METMHRKNFKKKTKLLHIHIYDDKRNKKKKHEYGNFYLSFFILKKNIYSLWMTMEKGNEQRKEILKFLNMNGHTYYVICM